MPERDDRLIDLAAALADGTFIDWDAAESSAASESERLQVRRMRLVHEVAHSPAGSSTAASGIGGVHDSLLHPAGGGAEDPAAPVTWGPLRVIEKIGRGRFGDVYRAFDPRLNREVALKLLRRRDTRGDDLGSLVIDEGGLLARVRHPNVVTVYGAERIDDRVGVWMELIRGRTLEDELAARGPLPPEEVAAIGSDVCRALAAVHRAGLVHRDVKAQNVMRDRDSRIVLMDFGTGRELDADAPPELAGTPIYLAPEVFEGRPATPQSDVYSVGVLLYHMATGRFPIAARTLRDVREAHARQTGDAATDVVLPAALRTVINRALKKDPASRFASAAEMEAAITGITSSVPVVNALSHRRRTVAFAALIAVATLAAAVAASVLWRSRSGTADAAATTAGVGERVLWSGPDTPVSDAVVSPNGRFIAYVESTKGNLMLRDLTTGKDRALTTGGAVDGTGESASQPVFSRDGSKIAYDWLVVEKGDDHWQLRTLDLSEPGLPKHHALYDHLSGGPSAGSGWFGPYDWSPDGKRIAVQMRVDDATTRIGWVSTTDGSLHTLASADWRMSHQLAWSPDSNYLAYDAASDQSGEPDVFVAKADGSSTVPIRAGPLSDTVAGWTKTGDLLILSEGRGRGTVWAQAIANGAPTGAPVPLMSDVVGDLLSPSASGALDLSIMSDNQALYSASVDFATGQLHRAPSPAVASPWQRNARPAWSSDGHRFSYITTPRLRQLSYRILSIQELGWSQPRILPLKLAQLWTYDFSPDGTSLLARAQSLQGEEGIFHIDARSGAVTKLLAWNNEGRQFLPQWAADGKSFYYTKGMHEKGSFHVLRNLETGHEQVLFKYQDLRLADGSRLPGTRDSTLSPDRKYLACYTTDPESVLWIVSIENKSVRELYRVKRPNAFVHNTLVWTFDNRALVVNQGTGGPMELWYVPLSGSPHKLDVGVSNIRFDPIGVHPDGSTVAFTAGDPPTFKIVRLENVLPARR